MRSSLAVIGFYLATVLASPAQNFTVLAAFNTTNGHHASGALIQGTDGNLYGTTASGGTNFNGTIFRMTTDGALTTLHYFTGSDGWAPSSALLQATDGNFYGTTHYGGKMFTCQGNGCGTVFRMTPDGTLTTLYRFSGIDGMYPDASLIQASDGNLYGVTISGGLHSGGTVFKVTLGGAFTTIYNFSGPDGHWVQGRLVQATDGNFYGTTGWGGTDGNGTIFRLTPQGKLTTLYSFKGPGDGAFPAAGLVQATDGNLYGTNQNAGSSWCGTAFKITLDGTLTTLYRFNSPDACGPGELIQAADGNFYGPSGGGIPYSDGIIFKMTPDGTLTTMHTFAPNDGIYPQGALLQASDGNFYGTTYLYGPNCCGTVFRMVGSSWPLTATPDAQADVTSADGYIKCGQTCVAQYPAGQVVSLTATTHGFSVFDSWIGCDSVNGNVCTVKMDYERTVTATYTPLYDLNVYTGGNGTVTSNDGHINCGTVCYYYNYVSGTGVTLTATPDPGWAFIGWSYGGCDRVNGNTCSLTMNSNKAVLAGFKFIYPLAVSKSGSGSVISGDGHISCGSRCSSSYPDGTQIGLSAMPSPGYTFSSWNGCDSTLGNLCTALISSAKNVSATFTFAQVPLTSLTLKPASLKGGDMAIATVNLGQSAPSGGLSIAVSSNSPTLVHPPAVIVVPGGMTSFSFAVRTSVTRQKAVATITATANTSHVGATLTLNVQRPPVQAPSTNGNSKATVPQAERARQSTYRQPVQQ